MANHIASTKTAATMWLERNDKKKEQLAKLKSNDNHTSLLAMSMADNIFPEDKIIEPEVEQPEALIVLGRLEAFGLNYSSGGYESQPFVLMQEITAALNARTEYQNLKAQKLELELSNGKKTQSQFKSRPQ